MRPEDFIRRLSGILLPKVDSARLRSELSAYADLHAIEPLEAKTRPSSAFFFAQSRRFYAGALSLVLVLAGGTQATLASSAALPGDLLYSMKVAVSEPMAQALSFSSEQRAQTSAKFATRRLEEAAALSRAGKFDDAAADTLAARFDAHVGALAKETESLEAEGEASVSLALRTDLEQKLEANLKELGGTAAPEGAMMMRTQAKAAEMPGASSRFSARVYASSRALAVAHPESEPVLTDVAENAVDLAVLRDEQPAQAAPESTATLFLASEASADAVLMSATLTASTTASSSEPMSGQDEERAVSPASRFFTPYFDRR